MAGGSNKFARRLKRGFRKLEEKLEHRIERPLTNAAVFQTPPAEDKKS